jgi:hypothetical protein
MTTTPKLPDSPEGMLNLLSQMTDSELEEMFRAHQQLEIRLRMYGPKTDDELHDWIKAELGIDIPRTSVCEGHVAPFTFLADLYFERIEAALGVANRGGAKTFIVAVLHWLNSRFKPGCESCTFGATEAQSLRCYAHLKDWIYDEEGQRRPEVVSSLMRETVFKNGSKVEVLAGTEQAVNGPHPQKAHADEIELMDAATWKESRNMTVSGYLPDGRIIIPQDVATSTRKGPNGRVQGLIDEIEKAVKEGYKPPRKLYMWCIKETAAQVKNCQVARPDLPDNEVCACHAIRKGEWEDGSPRLLRDICNGDFYRSRGWQPYGDIVKQFSENDRDTFEVQQLCLKPEMRHHYVPSWRDEKHCIRGFEPDPANGPIFTSTDWGGTNPHSVGFYQLLRNEVEVMAWVQPEEGNEPVMVRLKEGTIVRFDEIYIAEIGNDKLGELVKAKEAEYRRKFPNFKVFERFADPQGKAARMDWKAMGLRTSWHTTREFEEHVKVVNDTFEDDLFRVDGVKSPKFVWEVKQWRRNPKTDEQIDENNHAMSEFRYLLANVKKIARKALRQGGSKPQARSIPRHTQVIRRGESGPIGFRGTKDEYDQWRKSLGEPVTKVRNR